MMRLGLSARGVATIQEQPRHGFENVGVGNAGAFDSLAFEALQHLLLSESPAIELLNGTVTLTNLGVQPLHYAVVGATRTTGTPRNRVLELAPGQSVSLQADLGNPCWIGVRGLSLGHTLGTSSFHTLSSLGFRLESDAQCELQVDADAPNISNRFVHPTLQFPPAARNIVRFIPGPQLEYFSSVVTHAWKIDSIARSGIRLGSDTESIAAHTHSIPSLPVFPGVIQLPPDGHPILLGPDCGVTGGYPIVGVIPDFELRKLAWLRTGDSISLTPISIKPSLSERERVRKSHSTLVVDLGSRV